MLKKLLYITGVFFLLLTPFAHAEIYQYKTDKGQLWFVNHLNDVPPKYRDQILPKVKFLGKAGESAGGRQKGTVLDRTKTVELYVTNHCPVCSKVEDFLQEKAVPYRRYDINRKSTGYSLYDQMVRRGTPVTKINGEMIIGFVPNRILASLSVPVGKHAPSPARTRQTAVTPPRLPPAPQTMSPRQFMQQGTPSGADQSQMMYTRPQ